MPSLMADFIISLDGYAAADGWPGFCGLEGPEYLGWIEEACATQCRVLMAATPSRCLSVFAESDAAGLHGLAAIRKRRHPALLHAPLSWANTGVVDRDPVEAVREMKRDPS